MRKLFVVLLFLLLPFVAKASDATGYSKDCVLVSAASNNATNCTGTVSRLYGFDITNTTATIYYLRLYNLATAPTCTSATGFIRSIPLLATSHKEIWFTLPVIYNAGIGFCLTGGSASTDNTNAATGIFGTILYSNR